MREWQLYVIHHSHTDIGYTDRQSVICADHAGYLRQAVQALSAIDAGQLPGCESFRYQCENDWMVENFLQTAAPEEAALFARYVQENRIGLSASYLNLTELADAPLLSSFLAKARRRAEQLGSDMRSAMTADINGYAWGYPDLLYQAGVDNLFCALHTHHGMFPMGHNPSFFYWKGPQGGRVLTFVGEHYHWGNTLGLCPEGDYSFMIRDEFQDAYDRCCFVSTDAATTAQEEMDMARTRILRYLDDLEQSGYPLDLVPVMVSGVISDNAPPNPRIAQRIEQLNDLLAGRVRIRMVLLDEFFDALRAAGEQISEYSGDFTDWWANGVGSVPKDIATYREAQRCARLCAKLDPDGTRADAALLAQYRQQAMLFSEHTFNYSCSCADPYEPLVTAVSGRKSAYAAMAEEAARTMLLRLLDGYGRISPRAGGKQCYRVINPHSEAMTLPVQITLSRWVYVDGSPIDNIPVLLLQNAATGEALPTQCRPSPRGKVLEAVVTLPAGGQLDLQVVRVQKACTHLDHVPNLAADWTVDVAGAPDLQTADHIETQYFDIRITRDRGVASVVDKATGRELIDPNAGLGAFTVAYEVTPPSGSQNATRRLMGRNQSAFGTVRHLSQVANAQVVDHGCVYTEVKLTCRLEGSQSCDLFLKVYHDLPLLRARIRMHKNSVHSAESIYVALPFAMDDNETWIDKAGCVLRPGVDQLPGTCQQYWLLQNAVVRCGQTHDLLIGMRDTPLISLGARKAAPVTLCDGNNHALNRSSLWSWAMNNLWETNFNINLGGFHEYAYTVTLSDKRSPQAQMTYAAAINEGLPVFLVK